MNTLMQIRKSIFVAIVTVGTNVFVNFKNINYFGAFMIQEMRYQLCNNREACWKCWFVITGRLLIKS